MKAVANPNRSMMISFDEIGLQRYMAEDPGGPVVMLNLLRFRPEGGAEQYLAYVARFASTGVNDKYGVEIIYGGPAFTALVAEDGQSWHMIALVRYPSRQNFFDMVHDPDYQRFEHLRTAALVESVLQPTTQLIPQPLPKV